MLIRREYLLEELFRQPFLRLIYLGGAAVFLIGSWYGYKANQDRAAKQEFRLIIQAMSRASDWKITASNPNDPLFAYQQEVSCPNDSHSKLRLGKSERQGLDGKLLPEQEAVNLGGKSYTRHPVTGQWIKVSSAGVAFACAQVPQQYLPRLDDVFTWGWIDDLGRSRVNGARCERYRITIPTRYPSEGKYEICFDRETHLPLEVIRGEERVLFYDWNVHNQIVAPSLD